jgi:hypothetical protein
MLSAAQARVLRCLSCAYRWMLLAYPRTFRDEYSREMALAFRDRARDVVQSHGTLALVPFGLHVIRDWATTVAHERLDMDRTQRLNRLSWMVLTSLSLTALASILIGVVRLSRAAHLSAPQQDEGAGAHIFQLSIMALLPVGLAFLATADWKQPLGSVRRLALPAAMVVLAFSMLFYFEHVCLPAHGYPLPRPGLPLLLLRRLFTAL